MIVHCEGPGAPSPPAPLPCEGEGSTGRNWQRFGVTPSPASGGGGRRTWVLTASDVVGARGPTPGAKS
jgi:hypothetical protein